MQPQQPTSSKSIQVISTALLHNIDDPSIAVAALALQTNLSLDIEPCFPVRMFLFLAYFFLLCNNLLLLWVIFNIFCNNFIDVLQMHAYA